MRIALVLGLLCVAGCGVARETLVYNHPTYVEYASMYDEYWNDKFEGTYLRWRDELKKTPLENEKFTWLAKLSSAGLCYDVVQYEYTITTVKHSIFGEPGVHHTNQMLLFDATGKLVRLFNVTGLADKVSQQDGKVTITFNAEGRQKRNRPSHVKHPTLHEIRKLYVSFWNKWQKDWRKERKCDPLIEDRFIWLGKVDVAGELFDVVQYEYSFYAYSGGMDTYRGSRGVNYLLCFNSQGKFVNYYNAENDIFMVSQQGASLDIYYSPYRYRSRVLEDKKQGDTYTLTIENAPSPKLYKEQFLITSKGFRHVN